MQWMLRPSRKQILSSKHLLEGVLQFPFEILTTLAVEIPQKPAPLRKESPLTRQNTVKNTLALVTLSIQRLNTITLVQLFSCKSTRYYILSSLFSKKRTLHTISKGNERSRVYFNWESFAKQLFHNTIVIAHFLTWIASFNAQTTSVTNSCNTLLEQHRNYI